MDVMLNDEDLAFREHIRSVFRDEFPEDLRRKREKGVPMGREDLVRFQQWLHEKGWAGVNWPVEYGGTGWTPVQKYLFAIEMAEADAPPIVPFGLSMVGPVIYTYGSEGQKERFLPDILASRVWWCQGYSEPGAGSDLASLKTRADLAGDHYILNGTKTWTTLGQHADWMFLLARTSTDVARFDGEYDYRYEHQVGDARLAAPALAIDGQFPYLHLERKFMHLGFHIYDVSMQSPNVEAAKPMAFATTLVLLAVFVPAAFMPGITGDRLARKILDLRPDMPVILCTGYTDRLSKEAAIKIGIKSFLFNICPCKFSHF